MFLLEAMAAGVPVVQPRRGAFTEIVEQTGGGLLVRPDNEDALAEAHATVCGAIAVCARRWRIAGSTVSESTTRSRDPPIDCLRRTTPPSRVPRSARRMPGPLLQVADLTKEYPSPRGALRVLSNVSFSLADGDAAAVMGPSGSGKSSLLYIIGALEPPTSGSVTLDGRNPFQLDASGLATFRNKEIGFVFQDHCLLPQCTVLENVLIPRSSRRRSR